jgi:hypothetical protein
MTHIKNPSQALAGPMNIGITVQNAAVVSTLALLECDSKTEIQPSFIPKINYSRISTNGDRKVKVKSAVWGLYYST